MSKFFGYVVSAATLLSATSAALAEVRCVVSNVRASQDIVSSPLVDVLYDLSNPEGGTCTISIVLSRDGGSSWTIVPSPASLSGDWGSGVVQGNDKAIVWDAGIDIPGESGTEFIFRLWADGMSGQLSSYWSFDEGTGTAVHDPFGFDGLSTISTSTEV